MFGRNKEQSVREAGEKGARGAEVERLCALPVEDLAEEIMPAFGPDGPGRDVSLVAENVIEYLLASYPDGPKHPQQLSRPVREALQALEHASLILIVPTSNTFGGILAATRLGERALAEGAVRRYLDDGARGG